MPILIGYCEHVVIPQQTVTVSSPATSTTLKPSYTIPLVLLASSGTGIAIALIGASRGLLGLMGVVFLFGCFLLYQTKTLRLVFTQTDLEVYRGETRIRRFPYGEWEVWDIFWSPVPTLFYFREINSIHFLPVLFSPEGLRSQLEEHLPTKAAAREQADS